MAKEAETEATDAPGYADADALEAREVIDFDA